jgi:hypothetical protein
MKLAVSWELKLPVRDERKSVSILARSCLIFYIVDATNRQQSGAAFQSHGKEILVKRTVRDPIDEK